jgi:hypothetical protein
VTVHAAAVAARVDDLDGITYRARCCCGWDGAPRRTRPAAEADLRDHVPTPATSPPRPLTVQQLPIPGL